MSKETSAAVASKAAKMAKRFRTAILAADKVYNALDHLVAEVESLRDEAESVSMSALAQKEASSRKKS